MVIFLIVFLRVAFDPRAYCAALIGFIQSPSMIKEKSLFDEYVLVARCDRHFDFTAHNIHTCLTLTSHLRIVPSFFSLFFIHTT